MRRVTCDNSSASSRRCLALLTAVCVRLERVFRFQWGLSTPLACASAPFGAFPSQVRVSGVPPEDTTQQCPQLCPVKVPRMQPAQGAHCNHNAVAHWKTRYASEQEGRHASMTGARMLSYGWFTWSKKSKMASPTAGLSTPPPLCAKERENGQRFAFFFAPKRKHSFHLVIFKVLCFAVMGNT